MKKFIGLGIVFLVFISTLWSVSVCAASPLGISATADKTTVTTGESITFTVKASGGSGNYQYKYSSSLPNGSWKVWQDKTTKNTYTWTPKASDGYTKKTSFNFTIDVFDAATGAYVTQRIWVTVYPQLEISATADKTTVTTGESITFTVKASGGSGNYQYKYSSLLPNGSWKVWQDKTTKNTYTWTPKASDGYTKKTSFNFTIDVFDAATGAYVTQRIWVTVNPAASPLGISATADKTTVTTGESITFTVKASGGSGNYQYKYSSSLPNGSWKVWQDKTTKNTYTWTPKESDGYTKKTSFNFTIDVFDASTGAYVTQRIWVTVNPAASPLGISATADKTTVTTGESITFTVKASGGSGNYQYKYSSLLPNGSWKVWQDKTTKNTYTWTPKESDGYTKKTSFNFTIDVFDAATGVYVTQRIWVTVHPQLEISATADKTTVTTGKSITFTVKASGGSGNYQYKYSSLLPNGSWKVWQDKTTKNTYTWTPKESDGYTKKTSFNFTIDVFDASTGVYVTQRIWVTVTPEIGNGLAIDVSYANASVDWAKVRAAGYAQTIMRIGFTGYGSYNCTKDARFEENYRNATANGVQIGVYFFSYAISPDKNPNKSLQLARNEANFCVEQLKGKNITLPVVYDIEDLPASNPKLSSLGKTALTNNVLEFCRIIKAAGYTPMLYASPAYIRNNLDYAKIREADIPLWIAHYTDNSTYSFPYPAYMWQYTSKGSVPGVSGNVDVNRIYPENLVTGDSYLTKPIGSCISDGTNVRTGPGTSYGVLYTVNSGYKFSIIGENGNWYQASFGGDRIGWISKSYSKKI